jgi:hypothetical protein
VQAAKMADILRKTYQDINLTIHITSEAGRFDVKRGEADILKVE